MPEGEMDAFDAAFLSAPSGGASSPGGGNDDGSRARRAGRGKHGGGDGDAISVGSSSSSSSDGSSSSGSDDSSATAPLAPAKAPPEEAAAGKAAGRKRPTKSAYFYSDSDSSSEEEDDSVECLGASRPAARGGNAAGGRADAEDEMEGDAEEEGRDDNTPGNDKQGAQSSTNNDNADPLDADLDDDDDDDGLADFFSKPAHSPLASVAAKSGGEATNATREGEDGGVARAETEASLSPFDRLDALDDEAMAELDEGSAGKGDAPKAGGATEKGADSGAERGEKRDFTISYNGERREAPPPAEEVVDSSDDDDEEKGKGKGRPTGKENGSPNRSKMRSGRFARSHVRTESDAEGTEDRRAGPFDAPSPPKGAPDSPSSLDTPREDGGEDGGGAPRAPPRSIAMEDERKEAATAGKGVANPYRNPYRKQQQPKQQPKQQQQQQQQQQQKRSDEVRRQNGTSNQRGLSHDDIEGAAPTADDSVDASAPPPGVVALPDLGLAPAAGQTELQRLGIRHEHYKPPPYTPGPDPLVHKLDGRNRPKRARRNVAVDQVFSPPVSRLWRSKFAQFNHVQSEMAHVLAHSDDNALVSAPTGAGKTALFEMALARMFASDPSAARDGLGRASRARKAVYVAPNKALCEERQSDWARRLGDVDPGIVCATVTGDVNAASCYAEIAGAHLILTTPEKWDSITRRWNDQFVLLASVKLVLVDEVHMIGEAERGGTLESVIARMKTIQRAATARALTASEIALSSYSNTTPNALLSNMRIVAVSATLPNLGQLASFVESGEAYVFDQSYRPVPLTTYVRGCGKIGNNRYLFDKSLNQHVPGVLRQFANGRPAIVFCHSKKETEQLAEELAAANYASGTSRSNQPTLFSYANRTDLAALQRCLRKGVAFHNAGLEASDRSLVEEAFGSGRISCLCATSTLAMGVNLPSHLVVIKGTSAYRGAELGHQDIDAGALMQMMGRAGRPGFDESGTAVIMTDAASIRRYENLSQGLKVVESHLMVGNRLTEVLNIEISQGVIASVDDAVNWVKGSFLYRRIESHPLHYGLRDRGHAHSFVHEKCAEAIDKLRKIQAIAVDEDGTFAPAAGCYVMSRNFVSFDTMKAIVKMPHDSGPVQLLHMLSNCSQVQTQVRRNEKKSLNAAYKLIKYKLEGPQSKIRIQTPAEKAFVMLQASIGHHFFQDVSLRQQMGHMIDSASQILNAVEQYAKEGSGHGQVATQGVLFRRSLHTSLWGENDAILSQINGVTLEMAAQLKANGISTFVDAANSSDEAIASACNVTPTFASSLRAAASKILRRTLKLTAHAKEGEGGALELHVKLEPRVGAGSEDTGGEKVVSYSLAVFTDRAGGLLHYSEDITKGCEMRLQCPEKFGRAYVRLVSNLVGLDEQVTVDGNDKIQKSSFSLSPHVAKSSATKGKKQSKLNLTQAPTTSRKRTIDAHRESVSNVSDLRLHKRGKAPKGRGDEEDDCVIVDTEAVEFEVASNEQARATSRKSDREKTVTPSPHPRTNLTPVRTATSASAPRSGKTNRSIPYSSSGRRPNNSSWSKNTATSRKGPRNARSSSWFQEKKQQTGAQKTAFHSPKENPFSSYQFDPNNIENSLDSNANRSKIIPEDVSNAAFSSKKTRYGHSFRTPANRRKGGAASNRISGASLLQQKAAEMQEIHTQATSARSSYTNRGSMQRIFDAPSVRDTFTANNGLMAGQYGQSFPDEPNQFMMAQNNHFQRPGTSAGSVMMQQTFGMAAGPPSISPPPPFMGRSNNYQNHNLMQGPIAGMNRPMSSAGRSIVSHLRGNNFGQSYGDMTQQQHFGGSHIQQQNAFQSFQPQQDFLMPTQDFESFHGGFQQGMMTQQQQFPSHFQHQTEFDNAFDDAMCTHGLDLMMHGYAGDGHFQGQQFEDPQFDGRMNASVANLDSQYQAQPQVGGGHQFGGGGNLNSQAQMHSQYQAQPQVGVGRQFGGGGNLNAQPPRNPYGKQPPRNPYQKPPQMQQPPEPPMQEFQPPMQEVVVNNGCSHSQAPSGLEGSQEDASQFEDAFL